MATFQTCERQRGDSKCANHPHNEILCKCEQCGVCVCGECVTSKEHQGHHFVSLKGCYKQSKDDLHSHVWKLENTFLPKVRKEIDTSDHALTDRDKLHDTDVQSVNQLRHKCLDDMNNAFDEYVSLIDTHNHNSKEPILQYKVCLKSLENDVQTQVTQFKSVLETGTALEIHDDENQVKAKPKFKLPKRPDKDFLDKSIPYLQTEEAKTVVQEVLGKLDVLKSNKKKCSNGSSALKQPEPNDVQEDSIPLVAGRCTTSLTFTPYKVNQSREGFYSSICPISADTAWVTEGYNNLDKKEMNLINITEDEGNSKERIQQTIKASDVISSISAHPRTGQLYVALSKGSVGVVNVSKSKVKGLFQTKNIDTYNIEALFQTKHVISQIAVTNDDHIICSISYESIYEGGKKPIYKYTLGGKRVSTSDNEYSALDISVCSLTNHVAVACGVARDEGGVVVLDDSLKTLFKYGDKHRLGQINSGSGMRAWSAVFDDKGNALVGDGCNYNTIILHVVDGKSGQCLQEVDLGSQCIGDQDFHKLRLFENMLWSHTVSMEGGLKVIELYKIT